MSEWDSYGIPGDLRVDWSSLPTGGKKMKLVPVRGADGVVRQVALEEGMDPRLIETPEPPRPRTINDVIAEQDSFGGKLKTALNFAMDPVSTVHGPDAFRTVTEDLLGPPTEGPTPAYLGPLGVHDVSPLLNAGRTIVEKGMQMASSPVTAMFGVPGVATSIPGRLAAAGFGGMAAKGGGEQLGQVMAMRDAGIPMDDPEVIRALTSGALDLGMAPLAAAGALHGAPMKAARAFETGTINPAIERALPKVDALARELGYTDAPGLSRMAPEGKFKLNPDEAANLVEGIGEKKPVAPVSRPKPVMQDLMSPELAEALGEATREMDVVPERFHMEGLPKVAEGHTRIFRGIGAEQRGGTGPGWSTTNPAEAASYLKGHWGEGATGEGRLTYADLPPGAMEKIASKRGVDIGSLGELTPDELAEFSPSYADVPLRPKAETPSASKTAPEGGRIAELENIIDSDAPADVRLQAMMELEDLAPPEVKEYKRPTEPTKTKPPEKDIDQVFAELDESTRKQEAADEGKFRVDVHYQTGGGFERKGAFSTVEEALNASRGFDDAKGVRVVDPNGKVHYVKGTGPETIARRTVPPSPKEPTKVPSTSYFKSVNDVYDSMYGKGSRLKASQLKEGREVWNELKKRKELTTEEDLRSLLAERQTGTPVEKTPEVSEGLTSKDFEKPQFPTVEELQKQLKTAESRGQWSAVERLKTQLKAGEEARAPKVEPPPEPPKVVEPEVLPEATFHGDLRTKGYQYDETTKKWTSPEGKKVTAKEYNQLREDYRFTKDASDFKRGMGGPAKTVNPLEAHIPKPKALREVNPVKVFTGEVPEPKSVAPVKEPKVIKEVDTAAKTVEAESGAFLNQPPGLETPAGKKLVKGLAKTLGITEDKARAMVVGQSVPALQGTKATGPAGTPTGKGAGKTVPRAGKTVPPPSGAAPPGAPPQPPAPTPRLPKYKGKRPTLDILSWMRQRRSGDVLAEQTRRRFESLPKGVQAQLDFEAGTLQLPEVRKFLDRQHKLMRRAGVDVGYVENYITHLWKESPQQVRQVLGKHLGLKPGIAMTRSIPTLAEGIQKGLTPKYENMGDVLSWYSKSVNKAIADRGFFEWLREQKQLKPAGKAPYDWVTLDPDRFPIKRWKGNAVVFKAPKEMATRINEYLYDPEADPRAFIQGLSKVAKFSSFLKNVRLAAGVPFTKLNMHSFSVMAHHVLSTPTVKGVPNIPRMIGRGLKDFAEMADPRLHRWTNEELTRARLMQKNSPLTLSTEDHVFAPAVKGSLFQRLKESPSLPKAFGTIVSRMFEEPLFQNHLPKMKLNVAWELQKEYRKGGMGKKEAMQAAGEVTNNMFGGLNLDEMGRNKIGQQLARILVLAPDWLESNLKTTGEIVKSPLGRTPKEKTYRDFATNLLGVYVAGTILQKALTGRWMHENNPGNQFSIYLGKNQSNGKDRYVKPFGAGLAGVRLIYDSAEAVARRDDVGKFGELVRGRMSLPAGIATSTIFNKGPFGQPVTKRGDTLGGQLRSVGELVAGQTVPQYVSGPVAALKGDISPELGLAQAVEFPYTEVKRRPPDEKGAGGRKSRRRRGR